MGKLFCKKVPEVNAPWKFQEKSFYKQLLEMNETLNVTQFLYGISKCIKNCQQLKQCSWIPLLVPTKPQVNWAAKLFRFIDPPTKFQRSKALIDCAVVSTLVTGTIILHSTILRDNV